MPTHISTRNKKFESLFYTWNKKIYNYAYQKTNSSYIAEETVQRVFIKLWNNLENKKIDININAQIFCITRSILLDIIKQENKRNTLSILEFDELDTQNPSDIIIIKELQKKINTIVDAMPEARRNIFKMSRFENLKHKEIANILNISPKTVENHLRLALKALKNAITTLLIIILYFF